MLKKYCNSYLKRKNTRSVIIEHPKTSHKSFKAIRQAKKVSRVGFGKIYNSPLYSRTKRK